MAQATSNPALRRLDVLVGEWELHATIGGQTMSGGRTVFAWQDDKFLVQRADADIDEQANAEWVANSPFPVVTIIGLDDSSETYSMLYADARGVFRVYQMSLVDDVWKVWREAPGFHQRFTGTFSDDGDTITA